MDALFDAIKTGDAQTLESLIHQNPDWVNATEPNMGISAVMLATYYGKPAIADLLIEHGATLNMYEAAATGRLEHLKAVFDPATVDTFSQDGFTMLGFAAFFGHLPVAEFLLENGANPNLPSNNAQKVAPLHSATAGSHFEIVKLLVKHGADVNAKQEQNGTPLHNAAQNGHLEMVKYLLEHGADPAATFTDGRNAADFAREQGHMEVVELLGKFTQS